jgi:hypothetical protein
VASTLKMTAGEAVYSIISTHSTAPLRCFNFQHVTEQYPAPAKPRLLTHLVVTYSLISTYDQTAAD